MTTNACVRNRPESLGRKNGFAVPGFICNGGTHFFTELGVYADGVFECWGGVDLDFLEKKFRQGWIVPLVPNGAKFSIHDVIQGEVVSGSWSHDSRSFHERLLDSLHLLNPELEELVDFQGEDVEIRNGVRYAKIGFIKGVVRRQSPSTEPNSPTKSRYAFVQEHGHVYLTVLRIYSDGCVDVHPSLGEERLVGFDEFEKLVAAGQVTVTVPNGTAIEIDTLGRFECNNVWNYVEDSSDFLKEVAELIGELKGEPDSIQICRAIYEEYLAEPTVANRDRLRTAYEDIPDHHRMYVGDMDTKDTAVRMVIYGDQEIENWSHRAVARSLGHDELPTIEVPKPVDEDEDHQAD